MIPQAIIPPDRHGRLPRMHYDALHKASPTTRADIIAWCVAQRNERAISSMLRGATATIMMAVMKSEAPASRMDNLPTALLEAIEMAADDLHQIVLEFGYDPTGVQQFRNACHAVIMERVGPLAYDLTPGGDPQVGEMPSRDGLHQIINIAAVGTTLGAALSGETSAQAMLDALLLAFDESDNAQIKDAVSAAAVHLKEAMGRNGDGKREE